MYADISCSEKPVAAPRMQRAEGRARLVLHRKHGATRLSELYQSGCSKIRLPAKAIPTDPQEAILINTAGGLTGGDRIETEIAAHSDAELVVTTQACERVYRSTGDIARVTTKLIVDRGARIAWLPQETILFNEGRLARSLEADLHDDAELLAVESVLFGRKAMDETVNAGMFRDRWRIRRNGRLVFADDIRLEGAIARQLARPCLLNGDMAMAAVLLISKDADTLLDPVREAFGESGGASAFDGKLVARLTAPDSLSLRRALEPALTALMRGRILPKVWRI
ncbi:MAG: urease accessory protein UreD [Rhizobiaceae bacterium]|nr:urease accessory protein UreD [Rhizobiaceae bacterium]